jgi:hypothetical protein
MTKVYYTKKAKETPPYGAFEGEVIFRVRDNSESFVMRKYEFEWLAHRLFDNWRLKQSQYIQILKEWNECIGFQDIELQASLIHDLADTLAAIKMVEPPVGQAFNHPEKEDLQQLLRFLQRHQGGQIEIRER